MTINFSKRINNIEIAAKKKMLFYDIYKNYTNSLLIDIIDDSRATFFK
jgi:hypothetical protein